MHAHANRLALPRVAFVSLNFTVFRNRSIEVSSDDGADDADTDAVRSLFPTSMTTSPAPPAFAIAAPAPSGSPLGPCSFAVPSVPEGANFLAAAVLLKWCPRHHARQRARRAISEKWQAPKRLAKMPRRLSPRAWRFEACSSLRARNTSAIFDARVREEGRIFHHGKSFRGSNMRITSKHHTQEIMMGSLPMGVR